MYLRWRFTRLVAVSVMVCLFACSFPAMAQRQTPSMSEQEVHDAVAKLPVGKTVSLRLSTSGPGSVQYSNLSGRIASMSDASFNLAVGRGHSRTERTFAYKDVDEIHGTGMPIKVIVIGVVVTGALFLAIGLWNSHSTQH
jgi:hypothetical protein